MKFSTAILTIALGAVAASAEKRRLPAQDAEVNVEKRAHTGGVATFFHQHGTAGACGTVSQDTEYVVALYTSMYSGGSHCGRQVHITNQQNGKTTSARVMDECPTCTNAQSIDLSVAAFKSIATEEEGEVPVQWYFTS